MYCHRASERTFNVVARQIESSTRQRETDRQRRSTTKKEERKHAQEEGEQKVGDSACPRVLEELEEECEQLIVLVWALRAHHGKRRARAEVLLCSAHAASPPVLVETVLGPRSDVRDAARVLNRREELLPLRALQRDSSGRMSFSRRRKYAQLGPGRDGSTGSGRTPCRDAARRAG